MALAALQTAWRGAAADWPARRGPARRKAISTMLAAPLALALCGAARAQPAPAGAPRLTGSFLQLLAAHGRWRDDDWHGLFDTFGALGLSELVVQWSVLDGMAFHPAVDAPAASGSALASILAAADAAHMRVLVGLVHDSTYWDEIRAEPAQVARYLAGLESRSLAVADAVAPLADRHASFEGWYLTVEVDDVNWNEPQRRALLTEHLHRTSARLRRLRPAARIAVSGFSNARIDPQGFEAFWHELLAGAPEIGIVLMQDGVGVHKLEPAEVPLYLQAARNAVQRAGRELRAVVETFRQTGGPPLDDGPFAAEPATLERLRRQIETAAAFSPHVVAFSVPEYMSPAGGAAAGSLYRRYLDSIR